MLNEPLNILIYGPPGRGKTHFLGTAAQVADFMPAIMLDIGGGMRTIQSKGRRIALKDIGLNTDPQLIDVVTPRNWNELQAAYRTIFKSFDRSPAPYKCVMLDSLSELGAINLAESVEVGKEKDARGQHDPVLPNQQDYNRSGTQMRLMVKAFRDLPCPTIFTATARDKADSDGIITTVPNFPGKLVKDIPEMFDIVGYLSLQDTGRTFRRSLIMGPKKGVETKYRGEKGVLQSLDDPTLPLLLSEIEKLESVSLCD